MTTRSATRVLAGIVAATIAISGVALASPAFAADEPTPVVEPAPSTSPDPSEDATSEEPAAPETPERAPVAGPIAQGTIAGSLAAPVVTTSGTTTFTVTATLPAGSVTETGVAYAYQWLRNGVAISKATSPNYRITAADDGRSISVRVTASKSNYASATLVSAAQVFTITASGNPIAGGVLKVGRTLSVLPPDYAVDGDPVTPTLAYQWYRSGTAIPGATAPSYLLTASDKGKTLTVKVVASVPDHQSLTKMSAATGKIGAGVIQGDGSWPEIAQVGLALTSSLPDGSISESGVTIKMQWLRGGAAVAGKTSAGYTLTSADYGKTVSVRYTVSKPGYTSRTLTSVAENYSLVPSGAPKIVGDPVAGQELTVALPSYALEGDVVTATIGYQWYRSGKAIPGAVEASYTILAGDLGATVAVKVTASFPNSLPSVKTTSATGKVVARYLTGHGSPVTVTKPAGSLVLKAVPGVTESGATFTYQWFRGSTAVRGATKASYTLSAADGAAPIKVRVTVTKSNRLTDVASSSAMSYRLTAGTLNGVSGTRATGGVLTPDFDSADVDGNDAPATRTVRYQWFRGATAVSGSLAAPGRYSVVASDVGKTLTLKVTESLAGWLPVTTTAPTAPIALGALEGDLATVDVAKNGALLLLTAELPEGSVTTPGVTVKWQWFRGTAAVPGRTAKTYQLSSADGGSPLWVKATLSKPGYASVVVESTPEAHGIVADPAIPRISGQVAIGETLTIGGRDYSIGGDEIFPAPGVAYQWYRSGTAVSTQATYKLTPADRGKTISVKVTVTSPGAIPLVATSAPSQPVGDHALEESGGVVVEGNASLLLEVTDTGVGDASAKVTYQWLRNGATVSGKTAKSYQLTTADAGKAISVRVTATKSGFTPLVKLSAPHDYTLRGAPPVIAGTRAVGSSLTVSVADFSTEADGVVVPSAGDRSYQWYRSGAAIPSSKGGTAASYLLDSADLGKALTVKVTVKRTGSLAYVKTSAATPAIAKGVFTGTLAPPQLIANGPDKLKAELTAGSIDQPSVTKAIQWLRNGKAISGATKADYTLSPADRGASVQVRFTLSKSGFATRVLTTGTRSFGIVADQGLSVSGGTFVGSTLTVDARGYHADVFGSITPGFAYQWLRNGVAISGATGAGYTLTSADFGSTISVRVTSRYSGLISNVETWSAAEPVSLPIP